MVDEKKVIQLPEDITISDNEFAKIKADLDAIKKNLTNIEDKPDKKKKIEEQITAIEQIIEPSKETKKISKENKEKIYKSIEEMKEEISDIDKEKTKELTQAIDSTKSNIESLKSGVQSVPSNIPSSGPEFVLITENMIKNQNLSGEEKKKQTFEQATKGKKGTKFMEAAMGYYMNEFMSQIKDFFNGEGITAILSFMSIKFKVNNDKVAKFFIKEKYIKFTDNKSDKENGEELLFILNSVQKINYKTFQDKVLKDDIIKDEEKIFQETTNLFDTNNPKPANWDKIDKKKLAYITRMIANNKDFIKEKLSNEEYGKANLTNIMGVLFDNGVSNYFSNTSMPSEGVKIEKQK